ncbi:MAG: cell division protein ZapE, partial [Burkholderiales bacterium]
KGTEDPLTAVALRIAKRYRLICFDEFHVNDIADAMILGRLLERTIKRGVAYCMTSNYAPDSLYKDGLRRDTFMSTIKLIKEHLDVVNVDNGVDYRRRALEQIQAYHTPITPEIDLVLDATFRRIADIEEETQPLDIDGREIPYRHRAGGVVWFDFDALCGWGRSQNDYLDIAKRFHTVIVSPVPRMGLAQADAARRFTLMVDVFYDSRVNLILAAEAPAEQLLIPDPGAKDARLKAMQFEFERTASRLIDMQSLDYLTEARRTNQERTGAESAPAAVDRGEAA